MLKILNCTSDTTIYDLATKLNKQFGISFSINDSTSKISIGSGANIITKQGAINKQLELSKTADCSNPQILDIGETDTLTSLGIHDLTKLTTITIDENGNAIRKEYILESFDRTIYEMLQEQGANVTIKNGKIRFDGESIIGGSFVQERYGSENYYKYDGYSNLSYNTESVAQGLIADSSIKLADIGLTSTLTMTLSNGDVITLDPLDSDTTIRTLCDKSQGLLSYNFKTGKITLNQNNFMYISSADTDFLSNLGFDINAVEQTKMLINKKTSTSSSALTASVNSNTGLSSIVGTSGSFNLAINVDSVMTGIIHALSDIIGIDSAANSIEDFYSNGYYKDTIKYLKEQFGDDYLDNSIDIVISSIGFISENFFTALKQDNWLSSCYSSSNFDNAISNGLEALGLSDKTQLTFRQLYGVL